MGGNRRPWGGGGGWTWGGRGTHPRTALFCILQHPRKVSRPKMCCGRTPSRDVVVGKAARGGYAIYGDPLGGRGRRHSIDRIVTA